MSQPNTQDLQAVANSATKNFTSFVGGVEPVSSTKHMQDIYNGLGKLFDNFTQGALTQQGANSDYLLRTIYQSLDEKFLNIVKDTKTVDKITEVIKANQANLTPENVDSAMVSQTTKQVVLKTLTPDNCDVMQVVLDFMDELQKSILQVRMNLSRDYERRKIEWAKSREGQQQDIDNLNKTLTEQGQDTVDALGRMSDEDEKWKLERLNQIESMLNVLDQIDDSSTSTSYKLNSFNKTVLQDRSLQEMAKETKKIDLQKLVSEIQGSTPVPQNQSPNSPGQTKQGGFDGGYSPDWTKEQAQLEKEIQKEQQGLVKEIGGVEKTLPQSDKSKIDVSPAKLSADTMFPQRTEDSSGNITQEGVVSTIGKIHQNIQKTLQDKKFINAFSPNYSSIQKGLNSQMKKIDQDEEGIAKDLKKTRRQIFLLKAKAKANALLGMFLGGVGKFLIFSLGALILIGLARFAIGKWAKAYMPKSDGSKMTVFGVEVPGWAGMKALGLGIYNFITVGIRNSADRLSGFYKKMKKLLFGRKGALRDGIETRNTLRKIIGALVVANTKRIVGTTFSLILKGIGYAFSWIPGVYPVCMFLSKFGPMLYAFITTQLTMLWSNKRAEAERGAKDIALEGMADTQGQIDKYKLAIRSSGKNVKPFQNQINSIPSLMAQKGAKHGQGGIRREAIMRNIQTKYSHSYRKMSAASKVDEGNVNEQLEARMKSKDPADSMLVKLKSSMKEIADEQNMHMSEWSKAHPEVGNRSANWWKEYYANAEKVKRRKLQGLVLSQVRVLDAYIATLLQSTRFQNVKGDLYHPANGWNPGYRVYASDLKSIIPLNPFEALHPNADIYFGKPSEQETTSIGFMPFKWTTHDGKPVNVHPILYELQRARAIRAIYQGIYKESAESIGSFWGGAEEFDLGKHAKYWTQWNSPIGEHDIADYPDENKVLFKDRFQTFLNKFQQGKISRKDNSFEYADSQTNDGWFGISGDTIDAITGKTLVRATFGWLDRKMQKGEDFDRRLIDYDKSGKSQLKEGLYSKKDYKSMVRKRDARIKETKALLEDVSKTTVFGIKYGDLRDLMFNGGILNLFMSSTILHSIQAVTPILEFLIDNGTIAKDKSKYKDGIKATPMTSLMSLFFRLSGIKGFNWENAYNDMPSQQAFAQIFLEYMAFNFLPQWNVVEQLMSGFLTAGDRKSRQTLVDGIKKLILLFKPTAWLGFMKKYLRFPNMTLKLIDYSNADGRQKRLLDKYRKDLGIPSAAEKDTILKTWIDLWGKIAGMSDTELQKNIDLLGPLVEKALYEAKFTGDIGYLDQLKKVQAAFGEERRKRLDAQASGQSIVKKPGEVVQEKVLEPPKSLAEIEEEKRKREAEEAARKAEEERKAKEERERKLKEEAKRKEELVIAEAKIKAAETIRKQEQNYETILGKLIEDPGKVTDKDLKSLGDDVNNIKQEAENRIAKLPREERELKLALIRGDKISEKTFTEVKETAVGLHGNLQEYVEEVNKIPVGSAMVIQNTPSITPDNPVKMQDSDAVDLGDF